MVERAAPGRDRATFQKETHPHPLRPLRRETPSHPGDLVLIVNLVRTFLQEQKTPEGAGDSTWGIAEVSWSVRCEKNDFPLTSDLQLKNFALETRFGLWLLKESLSTKGKEKWGMENV